MRYGVKTLVLVLSFHFLLIAQMVPSIYHLFVQSGLYVIYQVVIQFSVLLLSYEQKNP